MIFVTILIILSIGLLGAYTSAFQDTTLSIGRKLSPDNPLLPRGLQDAITPKTQTVRNILFFISLVLLLIYGLIIYKWYIAFFLLFLTFLIVIPIIKVSILPKAGSPFYCKQIKRNLEKRLEKYKLIGGTTRAEAIEYILKKLESINDNKE